MVNQTLQNREEERIFKAGRQIRDAVPRKVTLKLVRTITKIGADGNEQTESKVVNEESARSTSRGWSFLRWITSSISRFWESWAR